MNSLDRDAASRLRFGRLVTPLRDTRGIIVNRVYGNRCESGDGWRYRGRGALQITFRANYKAAGKGLKIDLEGDPDRAAETETGLGVGGWFWKKHGLNK